MQYSVVNYKDIEDLETFRLDAEYFKPEYLQIASVIKQQSNRFISLNKLGIKCDASAFYPSLEPYYRQGDVPFIRVSDVDDGIDYDRVLSVPQDIIETYKTLDVGRVGDIVLTKGGSIARAGLLEKDSALTRDLIFFDTSKLDEQDYIFYYVYCLTDFYKNQLIRSSSMTAQPHLTITLVKNIRLFNPDVTFKELIAGTFKQHSMSKNKSMSLYSQAEELLLAELGLADWLADSALSFVKNYSDAAEAERIDAEYFQPKYEQIVAAIQSYPSGHDTLGNLVKIKDKNFSPKDDETYKYIELANISSNGEINGVAENLGSELPSRARRKVEKGDLIISSIEGSLESIALVTNDWPNALCSTGFFVVESGKINAESLLVFLKSKAGQMQLKKGCKGTILTAISKDDLSKIVLPKIAPELQNQIKEKITEMYQAKARSKSLLEIAKRGVEIAIEQDEPTAAAWINQNLADLNIEL